MAAFAGLQPTGPRCTGCAGATPSEWRTPLISVPAPLQQALICASHCWGCSQAANIQSSTSAASMARGQHYTRHPCYHLSVCYSVLRSPTADALPISAHCLPAGAAAFAADAVPAAAPAWPLTLPVLHSCLRATGS